MIDKTFDRNKVNFAVITEYLLAEETFNTALLESLERVKKEAPHGVDLNWSVVAEGVNLSDAERHLNEIARTGKYDIIWPHFDTIEQLPPKYPEILWAFADSGNALGGNSYSIYSSVHEAAYLLGIIAGMMTETRTIGMVTAVPSKNINPLVNAYLEGAMSVDPGVTVKITYIESWFNPPRAKKAALAQIAAGADFVYAERLGLFEACKEKGVYAFGHFVDQNSLAPEVVVSSTIARWDNSIKYIINEWWNHATKGIPYNAPIKGISFQMAEGGADIASYHSLTDKIPEEVKNAVNEARQEIKDGRLKIHLNGTKVEGS
jgi:basic membrane protein A and related proteins